MAPVSVGSSEAGAAELDLEMYSDHIESDVLLASTLPGPRDPRDEIEKHNLLHGLPRHGATSVSQRKGETLATEQRARSKLPLVVRPRCRWNTPRTATFDFMVVVDMGAGAFCQKIILQPSQRHSHQINGGGERMVRTVRNQINTNTSRG